MAAETSDLFANLSLDEMDEIILNGKRFVIFDLETTGLEEDCDIVQIACQFGSKTMNHYILPTKAMNPWASKVNGITVQEGNMFLHGEKVPHVDVKSGMEHFNEFLRGVGGGVILVAHNGHKFDIPRLLKNMEKVNVILSENVHGSVDTLKLARCLYSDRNCHTQKALVTDILKCEYEAHNATADVETLQRLLKEMLKHQSSNGFIFKECYSDIYGDISTFNNAPQPIHN